MRWRGGDKSVAPVMGQTELCFYMTRDDLTMYVNFFMVANMYLIPCDKKHYPLLLKMVQSLVIDYASKDGGISNKE